MDKLLIDLNEVLSPSILTAILIVVYNHLADQDPALAQDLADNLRTYRHAGRAPSRSAGARGTL